MKAAVNGTLLAWSDVGAGEPVVLIHGIAESRDAWRHQIECLSSHFRVVACDVRGFGESETGDAEGSPRQLAADIRSLLEHLRASPARIVGFSMGGVIAQRFAIDHPASTRAVVIAASSSVVNRRAAQYYLERAELADVKGLDAIRTASVEDAAACFAISPAEVIEAYRAVRRAGVRDPHGYANAAQAMATLHERPLTPELGQVRRPTLVITGERDAFCPPRASETIAGAIAGSVLKIVPEVGHCLHWEDPATFNQTVLDFLEST